MDGGGLVVPEEVQLPWVSVCQDTGHHHPGGEKERKGRERGSVREGKACFAKSSYKGVESHLK